MLFFCLGDQDHHVQVAGHDQGEGGQPHGGDRRDPLQGQQVIWKCTLLIGVSDPNSGFIFGRIWIWVFLNRFRIRPHQVLSHVRV